MEVTHREDHVTHAVIGGGESISMGITDDPIFMHMLSATLYSDKLLAVTRESLCNHWDAHIEAGRTDRAIEITLTDDKLTMRDFGFGIEHSLIGPIYGTYGASTKKHDGKQTGGFGLGCKSPFAYVDHFEVTSCHQGVKTIYRMTKSSAELNGRPGIVPLLSIPTEDEGLTLTLQVKDRSDALRFKELIQRLVANGEINAKLNGKLLPTIAFSEMKHGYVVTKQKVLEQNSRICLRYGNVIYPLEAHAEYLHDYNRTIAVLDLLGNHHGGHNLILQAKPNTLSITPSRESLSMEDKTIKTVTAMLKKFMHIHTTGFDRECMALVQETNEKTAFEGRPHELLRNPREKNLRENSIVYRNTSTLITDTSQAAHGFLSHTYPDDQRFAHKDMLHRLTVLIRAGCFDVGLIQSFRREYSRSATGIYDRKGQWFQRNLVAPLVTGLKAAGMPDNRLFAYYSRPSGNYTLAAETYSNTFSPRTLIDMLPFLRKLVVLTHSQNKIDERVRRVPDWAKLYGKQHGFMAYVVPRTPKKVEQARAFFATQNVVLIDLTLQIEKREPVTREKAIKKEKKVGHPTLFSSRIGSKYVQEEARLGMGLISRVEKPLFYTYLHRASDRYTTQTQIPDLLTGASKAVFDLWGKQGAVIFTSIAENQMTNDGVPSLMAFLKVQMTKLMKDKSVVRYLGSSPARMANQLCTSNIAVISAVQMLCECPALYEALKLGVVLPKEKLQLLQIWDSVKDRNSMLTVRAMVKDVSTNKKSEAFIEKLEASKDLPFIDFDVLQESLKSKDPAVVDHAVKFFLKTIKG